MRSKLNLWLYRTISGHRHGRPARAFATGARKYLAAFEHSSADARFNGEFDLLDRLASDESFVLIDCGANIGGWAKAARARFPRATIHAFEPIPETVAALLRSTENDPLTFVHSTALSDSIGRSTMGVDDGDRATASLTTLPSQPTRRNVDVSMTTGDEFLTTMSAARIHLLKIDAEGHDLAVLRGFRSALSRAAIDVIQFEVSGWNAVSRTWLGEFYDLLAPYGYEIGKIYPRRVDWRPYGPHQERFLRANFLATIDPEVARVLS